MRVLVHMSDGCLSPKGKVQLYEPGYKPCAQWSSKETEFRVQNLLLSSGEKQL